MRSQTLVNFQGGLYHLYHLYHLYRLCHLCCRVSSYRKRRDFRETPPIPEMAS